MKKLTKFVFILSSVILTSADLKCEIKNGVDQAMHKISDQAAKGLHFSGGRTKGYMRVLQCRCKDDDETFKDNFVDDLRDEFRDDDDPWYEAEILRIYDCKRLEMDLRVGRDTFADYMRDKILIVEDIEELDVFEFTVGEDNAIGTFSSIYIRNVAFDGLPPSFKFQDRFEVVFDRVNLTSRVNIPFKIEVDNLNVSRNPIFKLGHSSFPGLNSIFDNDRSANKFEIFVENRQYAVDRDGEDECNYNYQGEVHITNNVFGFLREKNVHVRGAQVFKFESNTIDISDDIIVDLTNIKHTHIKGNLMGFPLKTPSFFLFYARQGNKCDKVDLEEEDIGDILFQMNRFTQHPEQIITVDPDPKYSSAFINKFKVEGNEFSKRCNCTKPPSISSDGNDKEMSTEKLNRQIVIDSSCLSDQVPPLFGKRSDICYKGVQPRTNAEIKNATFLSTKGNWTIYLVVGIFTTMLVTAITTTAIFCFCCSDNIGKMRTVSPT